jgi:hypothetical protein
MMRHRPAVAKDEARDPQKKQSISLAAEDHTPSKDRPFRRPSPQLRLRISHLFPVTFLLGVLIGLLWRLGYSPHRNYDNHGKMREAVPHVPGVPGKFSFREKRDEPILSILPLQSSGAWQPSLLTLKASQRLFSELPPGSERTFYAHMSRVCLPIVRALHLIGWQQVDDPKKARLLYTYNRKKEWIHTQESWQRYNHVSGNRVEDIFEVRYLPDCFCVSHGSFSNRSLVTMLGTVKTPLVEVSIDIARKQGLTHTLFQLRSTWASRRRPSSSRNVSLSREV